MRVRYALLTATIASLLSTGSAMGQQFFPDPLTLDVPLIQQDTLEWCWIATAEMVIKADLPTAPSQCQMLEMGYGLAPGSCCANPTACTRGGHITEIQRLIAAFGGRVNSLARPVDPLTLYRLLAVGSPIIAHLSLATGGHFVVLRGMRWNSGVPVVLINDPMVAHPVELPFANVISVWDASVIVAPGTIHALGLESQNRNSQSSAEGTSSTPSTRPARSFGTANKATPESILALEDAVLVALSDMSDKSRFMGRGRLTLYGRQDYGKPHDSCGKPQWKEDKDNTYLKLSCQTQRYSSSEEARVRFEAIVDRLSSELRARNWEPNNGASRWSAVMTPGAAQFGAWFARQRESGLFASVRASAYVNQEFIIEIEVHRSIPKTNPATGAAAPQSDSD